MDIRTLGLIIIISSILIFLILFSWLTFFKKRADKRNVLKKKSMIFFNKVYTRLTRIPVIGNTLVNIRDKIYINTCEDDFFLRYKAIAYYILGWVVAIVCILIVTVVYSKDYYTIAVSVIMALYLKSLTIEMLIGNDTKVLAALIEFLRDVKHKFHEVKNIDEAFEYAISIADPLIVAHGKRMLKGLKSNNDLEEYYDDCLNKYFKIVAGYSFLTREYGDKEVNQRSLFVKNVNYIIDEIKEEIFKRDQLKYWLRSLSTISIVPIFFTSPIESWMKNNFLQSGFFYDSSIGMVCKILILIVSFISFLIIKKLERVSSYNPHNVKETTWEKTLLRVKLINNIVNKIKPKRDSKKYYNLAKLIQESGSHLKIEWLYVRKILFSISSFVLLIGLFITIHSTGVNSILNNASFKFISKPAIINGVQQDVSKLDKNILEEVNYKDEDVVDKVINKLKEQGITDDEVLKDSAKRIINKMEAIDNEYIKWWEVLLTLFLSYMAADIPILILYFQKRLRKIDMQDEVFQFDTIILLLMHHPNITIEMTLEWMERFSNVFNAPIKKCLNNIQKGVVNSLEEVKEEVTYKPFVRIVDNLIMAERISIAKAFESLETERDFYKDERKEANKRLVAERVSLGKDVGFAPAYVFLGLYLIIPMGWTAVIELTNIMSTINNI